MTAPAVRGDHFALRLQAAAAAAAAVGPTQPPAADSGGAVTLPLQPAWQPLAEPPSWEHGDSAEVPLRPAPHDWQPPAPAAMAPAPEAPALQRLLCASRALRRAAAAASATSAAPPCWPLVALLLDIVAVLPASTELLFASRAGAAVGVLLPNSGPGGEPHALPPPPLVEAARTLLRRWRRVVFQEWRARQQARC
ncbi:hypothetical protein Rsub_06089 [Raphidocelis subcapitata]|uniref:Uncharacterized protein n=1 Tax=Raphidocelis subcapitata TaxID=307507 RepID=A0A2V0P9B7_9CHLO|nr:hypothetical protein Rsub_06089 [Raphidocelis subcapitata]|eukprot:GBF93757.1 hypothetical protein Rsub_06089 [Raphidocelis subcapitata]